MRGGVCVTDMLTVCLCCSIRYCSWRSTFNNGRESLYASFFGKGNVVGVLLDLDNGYISYFLDGQCLGRAFDNVTAPLCAAVTLKRAGTKVTLRHSQMSRPGATPQLAGACLGRLWTTAASLCRLVPLPTTTKERSYARWWRWRELSHVVHFTRQGIGIVVDTGIPATHAFGVQPGDHVTLAPSAAGVDTGAAGADLGGARCKCTVLGSVVHSGRATLVEALLPGEREWCLDPSRSALRASPTDAGHRMELIVYRQRGGSSVEIATLREWHARHPQRVRAATFADSDRTGVAAPTFVEFCGLLQAYDEAVDSQEPGQEPDAGSAGLGMTGGSSGLAYDACLMRLAAQVANKKDCAVTGLRPGDLSLDAFTPLSFVLAVAAFRFNEARSAGHYPAAPNAAATVLPIDVLQARLCFLLQAAEDFDGVASVLITSPLRPVEAESRYAGTAYAMLHRVVRRVVPYEVKHRLWVRRIAATDTKCKEAQEQLDESPDLPSVTVNRLT